MELEICLRRLLGDRFLLRPMVSIISLFWPKKKREMERIQGKWGEGHGTKNEGWVIF